MERYLILDDAVGWRDAQREGLALRRPERHLTLEPLPGGAELLGGDGASGQEILPPPSAPELASLRQPAPPRGQDFLTRRAVGCSGDGDLGCTCPSGLAVDGCGGLWVVDASCHGVTRVDLEAGAVEILPAVGGEGGGPRQMNQPRGIAALPSGGFAVADTGNHRVQVFSPAPYALLRLWGAGDGPGEFRHPWALAVDGCGALYVVDRGHRRVQKLGPEGTWLGEIGTGELLDPVRVAVTPGGGGSELEQVAVVDLKLDDVLVFTVGTARGRRLGVPRPRSVAFGAEGRLYVGDAIGRVHVLVPDPEAVSGYRSVGSGVTGLDGAVIDLVCDTSGLIAIVREQGREQTRQRIWRFDPAAAYGRLGHLLTEALDSRIERCQWHRVALTASVPEGSSVEIESYTSETATPVPHPADPGFDRFVHCALVGDDDPDCLVQSGPGRYLWLRLTLRSNGLSTPSLRSIKSHFPRRSYLRYLPAVYHEDEESRLFLDRFLSIFQTRFDDLDLTIDRLWQLFDPDTTPTRHLHWLAGWLALVIDPEWPEEKLRQMIKQAYQSYRLRGTTAGLEQAVEDYAGVKAKILEHYRLRRWPALSVAAPLDGSVVLWSRDFYQRLQVTSYSRIGYFRLTGRPEPAAEPLDWGAHRFTVFFPADPLRVDEQRDKVAAVVEREKPAHTQATLCPVYPRLRVGVQATLGVDSVVAGVSHLVLNRLSTLGYDSILGRAPAERRLRDLGTTPRPRVGVSTSLR